jgi:hypothetical protein
MAEGSEFFPKVVRGFSLPQGVQTDFSTYSASCSKATKKNFPRIKRKASASVSEFQNGTVVPPRPYASSWSGA